jgi:ABC-2 type transport system permease protein
MSSIYADDRYLPTGRRLLSVLGTVFHKSFIETRRYPMDFVFWLLFPIAWFLPTYFLIQAFAPGGTSPGLESWVGTDDFYAFYLVGLLVGQLIMNVFWNIGFSLKRLMDTGLLETVWTCPVPKIIYILGESLFSMVRVIYEIGLVLVLYRFLFGMRLPPEILRVLPLVVPFLALMYGFGIGFAALVLLVKEANNMVDTSSFLVLGLTGAQNPPQVFPPAILAVSLAIPITYFVDLVRVRTLGIQPLVPTTVELAVLLVSAVVLPVLGIFFFRRVERRSRVLGNLHVH